MARGRAIRRAIIPPLMGANILEDCGVLGSVQRLTLWGCHNSPAAFFLTLNVVVCVSLIYLCSVIKVSPNFKWGAIFIFDVLTCLPNYFSSLKSWNDHQRNLKIHSVLLYLFSAHAHVGFFKESRKS